jgi:hypothetical protein
MKKKIVQSILFSTMMIAGYGQNWTELVKLESSDQQSDDNHAISVAISGDYAIAGAWHHNLDGSGSNSLTNAGAAYIYHYDSDTDEWFEEAKLLAADREAGDVFGISVDISGNYAVVGAVEKNGARGAAYVYEQNESGVWVQVAKLEAPIQQSSDRFGQSVAIFGNNIVVGAYHEDENENDLETMQNAGSAYIFTRGSSGWALTQKIVASDRDPNDYFGYSVGIWEDNIIVGAYHRDTDELSEYGGAYAFHFEEGEWVETKIMEAVTPYLGDRFGWSVDVYDNYYIVGAPYHDYDDNEENQHNNAGAAYIFDASNGWAQDKVVESGRDDQDNFGEDVAIFSDRAVVGAPFQDYDTDGGAFLTNAGASFVFDKDEGGSWNQSQKLITNDRFTADKFGHSVAIDNSNIIGGASEDNGEAGPSTGALYVFTMDLVDEIKELDLGIILNAFPNPTNSKILLTLEKHYSEVKLTIYNSAGRLIHAEKFKNTNIIDLDLNVDKGIYFITIISPDGKSSSIKVIKN